MRTDDLELDELSELIVLRELREDVVPDDTERVFFFFFSNVTT